MLSRSNGFADEFALRQGLASFFESVRRRTERLDRLKVLAILDRCGDRFLDLDETSLLFRDLGFETRFAFDERFVILPKTFELRRPFVISSDLIRESLVSFRRRFRTRSFFPT